MHEKGQQMSIREGRREREKTNKVGRFLRKRRRVRKWEKKMLALLYDGTMDDFNQEIKLKKRNDLY